MISFIILVIYLSYVKNEFRFFHLSCKMGIFIFRKPFRKMTFFNPGWEPGREILLEKGPDPGIVFVDNLRII